MEPASEVTGGGAGEFGAPDIIEGMCDDGCSYEVLRAHFYAGSEMIRWERHIVAEPYTGGATFQLCKAVQPTTAAEFRAIAEERIAARNEALRGAIIEGSITAWGAVRREPIVVVVEGARTAGKIGEAIARDFEATVAENMAKAVEQGKDPYAPFTDPLLTREYHNNHLHEVDDVCPMYDELGRREVGGNWCRSD